jgi:hypothetical protein
VFYFMKIGSPGSTGRSDVLAIVGFIKSVPSKKQGAPEAKRTMGSSNVLSIENGLLANTCAGPYSDRVGKGEHPR